MVVALLKIEQVVSNVAVCIHLRYQRPAVLTTGLFSSARYQANNNIKYIRYGNERNLEQDAESRGADS